ncbi:LAETG motif-containing sortase-dependent surface protein [Streptomyces sp. B1I3]|uniref:LAETG motif-containing sortase-dependent surface protein n=1 Tax=Streptomyces sp. B1I3 TaxID=3042264 RepID=UPI00278BAB82|nr:LAETG motif-containing sortase-dependent surface protein [Streptomyces sp. B1I3]MDQ0795046.1 LPXTG-motif cell wall-anchored protein [Streptomyces sp. B1I3]
MKIRRILATAVAAAVTTPALLLSVTPAFADEKPAAQTQDKPSIAELEKAAAAAQTAYDDAVAAESAAEAALEATDLDTFPLRIAAEAAKKVATEAAAAKTAADQAVVDAQAAIDALPETATEEEKTAAATKLAEAQTAAAAAGEAKTAAEAKATEAGTALDDERVNLARKIGTAQKAVKQALADKNAADAALAKAVEEEAEEGEGDDDDCVPEAKLTTVVTGLPSTVVAGTKVNFKLRVTNGTDKTMDEVLPFAYIHATDESGLKDIDKLVHLQWSNGSSSKWQTVDNEHYMDAISPLKAHAHADIKMRLAIDASAPAGNGVTFVAGDYFNDNGSCGGSPDLEGYEFLIAAAGSKPGKVDDAKPSTNKPNTSGVKPQSGASARPVTGSLAATGSSSATSQLALASGAAVAIGAGALFVVRRRKVGSDA